MTTLTPVKNVFKKLTDKLKKTIHKADEDNNVSLHSMVSGVFIQEMYTNVYIYAYYIHIC